MKALSSMSSSELKDLGTKVAHMKAARKPSDVSDNIAKRMKIGGAKVIDAGFHLPVTITRQDVKDGKRKDATCCAAAQAICRAGGFREARVHAARTYVKKRNGEWLRFVTPPTLRQEIVTFDRGGAFSPGDYQLQPIQPSERIGHRAKRKGAKYKKTMTQRNAAPPRPYHITTGIRSRFLPD